eukprot:TRINITY_DN374_c0_g2_i2.p1 TRINITY_DN374_c0_g2~~TRINITY_DN374_c0_g2_i2.p1  ORF type:complete len:148 (+),score=27.55 TRINITY_DN374_c0_g2_i2:60-446(+)
MSYPLQVTSSDAFSGTATSWTLLPSLELQFNTPITQHVLLNVSISRVQHSDKDVATYFRLVVDGNQVGYTNIGDHSGWNFRIVHFHKVVTLQPGTHKVSVEYCTQKGTAGFYADTNGWQERTLSAVFV